MGDFPETIPGNVENWATMCFDRSPEFKVHTKKGLALSAIANKKRHTEIALYELKDGAWTKVWEYIKPELCECGLTFKEAVEHDRYRRNMYNLPYALTGTVKDAPVICRKCWEKSYEANKQAIIEKREREQLATLQAKYDRPVARMGGLENLIAKD